MKFSSIFNLSALAAAVSAYSVTYDPYYDLQTNSLNRVACSDGENGLISRYGWQTLGEVPSFPFAGSAFAVGAWNSPYCGSCWRLDYEGASINVLAVDTATDGFNIGFNAMQELTNGQAEQLGRIEVTASQVDQSECDVL